MNLTVYKKPALAILESQKKLRDYPKEIRLGICKKILDNLLLDLGVGNNADVNKILRVLNYLNTDCGNYAPEEIEEAFKLAISGKLEIDLLQQINVLIVGKVLKLFTDYKNQKLKNFRLKSLKPKDTVNVSEKIIINNKILERVGEFFKKNRFIDDLDFYAYDILEQRGIIDLSIEEKDSIKKDAICILQKEYSEKKSNSREDFKNIQSILKGLKNGNHSKIKIRCKVLALQDYFRKA